MAFFSRMALGGSLVAALASASLAQDNALKPIAAGGSVQIVKLSTVMNSKVLIQDDQAAGQIVDVVMNESGCIDYVVASYEEKFYAVPYSAVTLRGPDRIVYIDIAPTQFRRVSFFTGNQWPDFYASTYQQNVFNVFGVTTIRRDGPRRSLKPDLDGDLRDRDRNDDDRKEGDRPKNGDRPKAGEGNKDNDKTLPGKDRPRDVTPTDRLKGDAAPESRDKNAPITKPTPGAVNPPAVKPELPNPQKPSVPKVEAPKADLPKIEQPQKPKTPKESSNPK